MLINHAESEMMGVARIGDHARRTVDVDFTRIRTVIPHDAFYERALTGTVFAQDGMEGPGLELDGHIVERRQRAEVLAHANDFDARRRAH